MPFTEDLTPFFADFGEPVTVAAASLTAIFDNAYASAFDAAGLRPMLTCRSADVPGVVAGAAVVVRGVGYSVVNVEPDGTGVTRLILQRS